MGPTGFEQKSYSISVNYHAQRNNFYPTNPPHRFSLPPSPHLHHSPDGTNWFEQKAYNASVSVYGGDGCGKPGNYPGNNMAVLPHVYSDCACRQLCVSYGSTCKSFAWVKSTKKCYLKSDVSSFVHRTDIYTGIVGMETWLAKGIFFCQNRLGRLPRNK